jgi:hypothetical protein
LDANLDSEMVALTVAKMDNEMAEAMVVVKVA